MAELHKTNALSQNAAQVTPTMHCIVSLLYLLDIWLTAYGVYLCNCNPERTVTLA